MYDIYFSTPSTIYDTKMKDVLQTAKSQMIYS